MLDSFQKLVELARLLKSEKGCPWDHSRTLPLLQADFMEEAEEVREALERKDDANLREEMGDVLYTMILMGLIAEEEKKFTLKDVFEEVHKKIVSRHTWVFGADKASTPEEALKIWKKNKKKEKKPRRKPNRA